MSVSVQMCHHSNNQPVEISHWADEPLPTAPISIPLVFDLDGTLLATDSAQALWRAAWKEGGSRRLQLPLFYGLSRNSLALSIKTWSLSVLEQDGATETLAQLAWHQPIIAHALAAQAAGRILWLVSGTLHPVAHLAAERLLHVYGLAFARVQGSSPPINLIGRHKAHFLNRQCPQGFDYVGDHPLQDIPLWQFARKAYMVKAM